MKCPKIYSNSIHKCNANLTPPVIKPETAQLTVNERIIQEIIDTTVLLCDEVEYSFERVTYAWHIRFLKNMVLPKEEPPFSITHPSQINCTNKMTTPDQVKPLYKIACPFKPLVGDFFVFTCHAEASLLWLLLRTRSQWPSSSSGHPRSSLEYQIKNNI